VKKFETIFAGCGVSKYWHSSSTVIRIAIAINY
jgi:hypothetical protein